MTKKKKSLFERAIDALTNRAEKEEDTEQARGESEARTRLTASRGALRREAAEKAAGEHMAADKPVSLDIGAKTPAEHVPRILATEKTTAQMAAGAPVKGVVKVRSLRIRADHTTSAEVVGGLVKGNEVTILETWTDGKSTWARLDKGWSAMVYNGETYIELSQSTTQP